VASGGTAAALRAAGHPVIDVRAVTGQDEILGGRVKTLHPAIAAGILARTAEDLADTGFAPIDLVVVNLYDFEGAVARGAAEEELVEAVDIGGPTLLRAAAKNCERVTVVCDPRHYDALAAELAAHAGGTSAAFRRRMAGEVFARTGAYDSVIARELFAQHGVPAGARALRYGENPHQLGWWRVEGGGDLDALGLHLRGGKELSYNNLLDLVAALQLALDLPSAACAVVKHTNPCGVGLGRSPAQSLEQALACDPLSAFGGIVALRGTVDAACATVLAARFLEVVAADGYDADAAELLAARKNLRWLDVDWERSAVRLRGSERRFGRLLVGQQDDDGFPELAAWPHAGGPVPDAAAMAACALAWRVAKHVKSNAIVLASTQQTLGIGAGQMSRVDSCRLAVRKAQDAGLTLAGCSAASDGFFPFPDGLEVLAQAGVAAVLAPGGSIRDAEVAQAADRLGVSLALCGRRHFRH
jgi:phosphoribosylaminoimidazolecarboxamide formyltransferase/IMP cyclohydrolase